MILTRIIVVCAVAIVLGKKIEKTQFVAMLVVRMVMMGIKMRHQSRNFRQLSRERRQALREQDEGK